MKLLDKLRSWVPPLYAPQQTGEVFYISGSYATIKLPCGKNEVVNIETVARRLRADERGGGHGTVISWHYDGVENFAIVRSDDDGHGKVEYILVPEKWINDESRLAISGN